MIDIVHSGITVSSLERSIPFYQDILGLKLIKREPVRRARGEKLGVPGAVIQLAIFQVGNSEDTLELIEYLEPAAPNAAARSINVPGQVHIAFSVEDIEAEMKRMADRGVAFVSDEYEEIKDGPLQGMKWIYFKDPDGTHLELIEQAG
jgi:catechol 2,3-dioxygenase-like lactoylglutathione lyase family enzyme